MPQPVYSSFLEAGNEETIDAITAAEAIAAGADVLVAGTATFRGGPVEYAANIARLRGA
jgi:ribulose-phosphate 3-epimerase